MVVKLADKSLNYEILLMISKTYGGSVRRFLDKPSQAIFVQWVINDKQVISDFLVPLFEIYPPLTSNRRLQFEFIKSCLQGISIDDYFIKRNQKYDERSPSFTMIPNYFDIWLAGFIEAEGCFSCRTGKAKNFSFSIAQKYDQYLIEAIRSFFSLESNQMMAKKNELFELSTGSISGVSKVIDHCVSRLQGHRYYQLAMFVQQHPKFKKYVHQF